MTTNTGFEGFSDAPAPMALGDLESTGAATEAAPGPMDIGGLGAVTGDAPAPAPLELEAEVGAVGETAPAPADIGPTSAVAEVEGQAPTPHGGPGDVDVTAIQAEATDETAPTPMDLSELEAMEAG